jgi:hypothetical protein
MIAPVTDWGRNKAVVRNPGPSGPPPGPEVDPEDWGMLERPANGPDPGKARVRVSGVLGRGEQRLRAGLTY